MTAVDTGLPDGNSRRPTGWVHLPLQLAPLIAREREVEIASSLLRSDAAPLLTVTGAPGVGKTHFALAVAGRIQVDFPDGVRFVDLAAAPAAEGVLETIAAVLGARTGSSERALLARLAARLRGRRLLLVIDTFSHRLAEALRLAELLVAAPGLRILATSREPLRLGVERTLRLGPLALPGPAADVAAIAAAPAVQVFVRRARAADPTFELTEAKAAEVAAICARTDGLPLALEAAAERAASFGPAAILADPRAPDVLLRARDVPGRHRTVSSLVGWSARLLTDEQAALLRRLGVFAGGFTLDAARAVARAERST